MTFHPTADQRELITDAFSRPLDALLPLDRLHQADAAEPWAALAELGIFGVGVDAELGGVGLSAVEEALLATELGKRLAGPQILATMMAAHLAEGETLGEIAAGGLRVAPAVICGTRITIQNGADADLLLLRREGDAALVPASAVTDRTRIDDHHWTAPFEAAAHGPEVIGWASGEGLLRVRLIEAAALAGIAARAGEIAVDYAGFRQQFGHPIGAFQAIKHHCANMAMAALAAGDLVTFASAAVDQGRPDAAFQVEAALLLAIEAALGNSRLNIQVHGGIGFSEEASPHLLLKRAHLLVEAAGGAEAAADRVAIQEAPMRRAPHN
ncbi:MAG: acyl-CoA dehydrogenase family protein [Sphingomonas sp.]